MNNQQPQLDYAGKYLKDYEGHRYTFWERNLHWLDRLTSIIVPPDAESFYDVSFYQAGMNWNTYAQHARAVIIRIGQNLWKDTEFEYNYREAKARGLAVGGYWFYDGRVSPQQQANVVIASMQGKTFEMEMVTDWERNYGGAYEGLENVVKFMQLLEAAGIKSKGSCLYTGYYWFTGNSNASTHAAQYTYLKQRELWLAWFASASVVKVPLPWLTWRHWQYGTPALSVGQPTLEIDANRSNGTKADFTARYFGIIPPPIGENMKYEILQTLNMRNAPVTGSIYFALPAGSFVWGVRDPATNWIHIAEFQLTGGVKTVKDMWCSGLEPYVKEVIETPPPPAHTVDVLIDGVNVFHKDLD